VNIYGKNKPAIKKELDFFIETDGGVNEEFAKK